MQDEEGLFGESVSMRKEEDVQSHNAALWKRKGKRNPAQREKGSRAGWPQGGGRLGVTQGSIFISQSCCYVQRAATSEDSQFGIFSSGTCTHLPPSSYPLGCFICDYLSIFMQWKEF